MRHFVIVGILVIIAAVLIYIGLDSAGLMPVEASVQATDIDWMWNLELIAMSFLFALIVVPLVYSLVVPDWRSRGQLFRYSVWWLLHIWVPSI